MDIYRLNTSFVLQGGEQLSEGTILYGNSHPRDGMVKVTRFPEGLKDDDTFPISVMWVDRLDIQLPKTSSVLQPWVEALPLRFQGTLLTCVRGCDLEPKQWTAMGFSDSPGRRLTAFIRWCFLNPADVREVDIPGAFFQSEPPKNFKPSEFGHLPLHWYTHAMHSLEVIGYCHPVQEIRVKAFELYCKMAHGLHLPIETYEDMHERLTEDRIENDTVVS